MKRVFLLLITFAICASCSNDDDISTDQIVGEWKLIQAEFYGSEGESSIDYSDQNIIYDFRQTGLLKVTGGENAGYPTGEYQYSFGKDHFGCAFDSDDPKILVVKINNSKWAYNFINGKMKLNTSCVDRTDLVLEKQ
ncbi:hypothetical protein [Salegentibacter flavus]|uniref:Lipocalin-like domain-containing protein n=1 Tax=Salegentibacter flavus TaxID=287099 RepID=A0A1I5DJY7_9FLAO|nr:hypothetical protein [Salegentibacter flavus]SFN99091.1 hypothetical protein SAMN05660413_03352 [Salegentibacter flavus]